MVAHVGEEAEGSELNIAAYLQRRGFCPSMLRLGLRGRLMSRATHVQQLQAMR